MDVFSLDQEKTVYNTEMQASKKIDLIRRSRFYQSLIDSSLLEPGSISYNLLNNSCIIMITPFDLFGEGKYFYSFIPCCKENKQLEINDGTIRIFLNTKGTNDHEVSRELRDFLHYVESLDENLVENSERLKKIHACVNLIKSSEEMGVKYMQKWEEKQIDREECQKETTFIHLQTLMKKQNLSMEEALSILDIPQKDWEKYLQLSQ